MINIIFNKEDLIKSPLNYTGSKYKLLPQILPLFPNNINTFVDLFAGGCNVGVNISAYKIICNDILGQVIDFYRVCQINSVETMLGKFQAVIDTYELSRENKEGYLQLRQDYNDYRDVANKPYGFYMLVAHSFSNQIRFNKKGEFNLPFGKRTFNGDMRYNFVKFVNQIKNMNIEFVNDDFRQVNLDTLGENDFIYIDPPYSDTTASYNENNKWNMKYDLELFNLLNTVNERGVKFAMSNIYKTEWLIEWSKKYNVNYLDFNYKNCNYQKKDKSGNECEVLITNY